MQKQDEKEESLGRFIEHTNKRLDELNNANVKTMGDLEYCKNVLLGFYKEVYPYHSSPHPNSAAYIAKTYLNKGTKRQL
jgi:hypothetical protein